MIERAKKAGLIKNNHTQSDALKVTASEVTKFLKRSESISSDFARVIDFLPLTARRKIYGIAKTSNLNGVLLSPKMVKEIEAIVARKYNFKPKKRKETHGNKFRMARY